MNVRVRALGLALALVASQAQAGAFLFSTESTQDPFIIHHTPGYVGAGGLLTVGVCLEPGSAALASTLDWALKTWNERRPMKNNCEGPAEACLMADAASCLPTNIPPCTCGQTPFPVDTYPCLPWVFNAGSILVHELGHCAFGLGHNNWVANGTTSFTTTKLATSMNDGADDIKGSKDDTPVPNPGSSILHWFRTSDNDPFVLDTATAMNNDTFSRNRFLLPSGSSWPASANIKVAGPLALNAGRTQAGMVSVAGPNTDYIGLVGDEVNSVRFGFSGVDTDAGDTADDYTIQFVLEPSCATAAIEVQFTDFQPPASTVVGQCFAELDLIPVGGNTTHYQLVPEAGYSRVTVKLDSSLPTDMFWRYVVMNDGFEIGDASWWSSISP